MYTYYLVVKKKNTPNIDERRRLDRKDIIIHSKRKVETYNIYI